MLKKIIAAIAVAASLGMGAAHAVTGNPPTPATGPGLVDGSWLNGLAGGQNQTFQSGISAAGTNQATATQLPAGIALISVDTVASSTGVALPPCIPGTELSVYNNGAQTLTFYPTVANNPATGAQDTINNATSTTTTTHTSKYFYCPKSGVWAAQ